MTLPNSAGATAECEEYFERALHAPKGLAVTLHSTQEVHKFRLRMNSYRAAMRKRNRGVYPLDHPLHGTTPYDKLQLTLDPNNPLRVLIKPFELQVSKVEEL